jgi:hypothetical protein
VLTDSSRHFIPALDWLGGVGSDAHGNAERRAEDLIRNNRGLLTNMRIEAEVGRVRGEPGLHLQTSTRVGAIPLRSPVSGRADFGLVVTPRFPWSSLGEVLSSTGFRIVPSLLPLPELPQSERRIPPWVLTSVVLQRLERLLDATSRRFETVRADLRAPRGAVDWTAYATQRFPVGRALDVPCTFPDLRDDEQLRSAIHWTVLRHREALLAAPAGGLVVRKLLVVCERLLARLAGTPPQAPAAGVRAAWQRTSLPSAVFREGLAAIDWTVDERGLAGLSDLSGLAWRLDMDEFFESWVETIAAWTAAHTGATLSVGRKEETRVPLDWSPASAGSQRSLLPDVVVVIDAKYKQHAEEIDRLGWHGTSESTRERHRNDLLQALAYSTLFDAPRVVTLLAFPCETERWNQLNERGRVLTRARVRTSPRHVEVGLLAVPLDGNPAVTGHVVEGAIRMTVDEGAGSAETIRAAVSEFARSGRLLHF